MLSVMRLRSPGLIAGLAAARARGVRWQAALFVLVVLIGLGCAPQKHAGHHEHRFQDAERWARAFDDPARDAWQKPDDVIRALALTPDALVADIGSGTGYFAVRLARAVPQGHVYGADIEPDMVKYLAERGRREHLANLTAVEAAPGDPRLPRAVDLVLVVNTYHHIAERPAYFDRLRPSLRSAGRVAIIDFLPDAPAGPPRQARIAAAVVKEEMGRAGYGLAAEHAFLPNQYFLVFAPR
jgi:SAM-dependent methyltransferase